MGKNITATLAFGVDLGEEPPFNSGTEDDPDTDLGKYLADRSGAKNPWDDVPANINDGPYEDFKAWEKGNPDWQRRYDEWITLCGRLAEEAPIEVGWYGTLYGDYTCYVLVLKGSKQEGDWSSPKKIDASSLASNAPNGDTPRVRKVVEWCKENGLPSFEGAGWLLYALEG